jgi:N-hydroxyarylamine O-acetyltransferase
MSATTPDLDAYFARIAYDGPRDATLSTLTAIHRQHARAIPYENLDVLLGRPISLEPAAIAQKLVLARRGGYCFEQNALFRDVLCALGFRVTQLIARVRWQVPVEVSTALVHMVLRVDFDDRALIADVGFGSRSLITPLALEFDREQGGSIEPRRLLQRGALVVHQTLHDGTWVDVYQFSLDPVPTIDFELGNWFTSTHPQSRFRLNLTAARAGSDCRYALLNREFTIRYADGRAEKRLLTTPDELLAVLADHFGLHFPPHTRFGPPGSPWPS